MARSVIGALRVTLGLDSAEFSTGLNKAGRDLKQFQRSSAAFEKSAILAGNAIRGMASALGIVSVGAAARGFLSLADQSKQMTAQLKLATAQTGSFTQAQKDVQRIAAETRTGLGETVDLYARFARGAGELGISQQQVADITQATAQAFKISGASSAEAGGAIRQLGQAFASGVLRGDEFNSIMEQGPRLAKLLADSLGVPVGQLRAMAEEGELTADKLVRAFSNRDLLSGLQAEFNQLPVTFDEAMTQVQNAAIRTFGAFDQGGEFSTSIAGFITGTSSGFGQIESDAAKLGADIRATFAGLEDAFEPLVQGAIRAFGLIENESMSLADRVRPLLGEIDAITGWIGKQGLGGRLLTGGSVSEWWNNAPTRGTTMLRDFNRGEREKQGALFQNKVARNFSLDQLMRGDDKPAPKFTGGGGGKKKGGGGKSAETLRREADRQAQRAADNLRQFTNELAREQADLTSSLAELTRSIEQRADAEINEIEVRRQVRERDLQADRDLTDAQRQQLMIVNNQNADAQKALVRQRLADDIAERNMQIETDRARLATDMLNYSRDLARTAQQSREIELKILDLNFEEERARLEYIKATNEATSAAYKEAEARLAALPQMQAMARAGVEKRTQGPMEAYLDSLPRSADEAREALERVQVDGIQGLVDGLAQAVTGAQSLGDVFKNVANQIIADLVRIQLQKALVGALGGALGGLGSGFGGAFNGGFGGGLDQTIKPVSLGALPGFATGGSFKVGGPAGVDKSLVQFRATRGEMVDIRKPGNDNGGKAMAVHVEASKYFDVHVAEVAAPLARQGGLDAVGLAERRSTRRQQRQLGKR